MSKTVCTFPGKFGDILWALPTVREISRQVGYPVDMQIMPAYKSLLSLLEYQEYIDTATVNEQWICTGSPHGDQPWEPQNNAQLWKDYQFVFNLGYRAHPGIGAAPMPLIDFTAWQQGIKLKDPIPFIQTLPSVSSSGESVFVKPLPNIVVYSFNEDYVPLTSEFMKFVHENEITKHQWVDVGKCSWEAAAYITKRALCFVGCRSAAWVVANGVGQENIFIYEPNPSRHRDGQFGYIFSNPYSLEATPVLGTSVEDAARQCTIFIKTLDNQAKEKHAATESGTR